MSSWAWYKPHTWLKAKALPIEVAAGSADRLVRHAGRLLTLYTAEGQGRGSREIRAEIVERKKAITAHGLVPPRNVVEAEELLGRVKG